RPAARVGSGSGSRARSGVSGRAFGGALSRLHAVLRAGLLAVRNAGGVERSADHLVANARQGLDPAAADEHDRVLLEVVALARDVARDLHPVREPHAGDLSQRRVRLLRGRRVDARAHAAPLRSGEAALAALPRLQTGGGDLLTGPHAALSDQLIGAWHGGR